MRRVLTELLMQLSSAGSDGNTRVYMMAATNRLEDLDPALLRRFDRRLEVHTPRWCTMARVVCVALHR